MKILFKHSFGRLLFLIFFLSGTLSGGVCVNAAETKKNEPIHIEADKMISHRQENAVIFSGNVKATQGNLVLNSDQMTVYHNGNTQKSGQKSTTRQQIKKIFATGNVKLTKQGWMATGDKVDFFSEKRKVLLTGNIKVWQENNIITGESVLLNLDDGTTVIEPDKEKGERVKAFFYTGAKE